MFRKNIECCEYGTECTPCFFLQALTVKGSLFSWTCSMFPCKTIQYWILKGNILVSSEYSSVISGVLLYSLLSSLLICKRRWVSNIFILCIVQGFVYFQKQQDLQWNTCVEGWGRCVIGSGSYLKEFFLKGQGWACFHSSVYWACSSVTWT